MVEAGHCWEQAPSISGLPPKGSSPCANFPLQSNGGGSKAKQDQLALRGQGPDDLWATTPLAHRKPKLGIVQVGVRQQEAHLRSGKQKLTSAAKHALARGSEGQRH